MGVRESSRSYPSWRHQGGQLVTTRMEYLAEEPLAVRVEDASYAVVMRTPGDEAAHAAGFCLAEGLVDGADDFETIGHDEHGAPNQVDVWLTPERRGEVRELLARQTWVSRSSCGVCGKQMIEDLQAGLSPMADDFGMPVDRLQACLSALEGHQVHYPKTRASHAALVLDARGDAVSFAEDVGRHNALDKAIGKALLEGELPGARIVVLSSRNSYELVQKAARARVPVMLSRSRPTALAVEMGQALGMTLAFAAGDDLVIACGEQRATKP